ncbi:TetR/AcrR family transcriptional regulator [Streptomyces sp. NPDC020917]|uniref:TetR/AcrR family transcriptional regulator n=1 Tax=Streptomyces sp. NPDC020917 TaxID=3365102 RepID=UPI0037997DF1
MDKPLRADARRNRDRLLEVARDAFAQEGVAVPLDEIARRAGVGPGTLYRHFPTKEALLEAVVHERMRRLVASAEQLGESGDAGAAFFGFLDHMVREAAPKRDLVDALIGAGVDVRAAVAEPAARLREETERLLVRAQHAGAVRPDVTSADVMALLSGLLVAVRSAAHPDAVAARMTAVLLDGLRDRPGPRVP